MPTSPTIVAVSFLRGINVGGHNLLPMAALRELYADLGLSDVKSYVQSGNLVFRTAARDLAALGGLIEDKIEKKFGFRPSVMLRTLAELRPIVAAGPPKELSKPEPNKLIVMFLSGELSAAAKRGLHALPPSPERVFPVKREIFIYFPNGAGKAKLSMAAIERAAGGAGTCRNWNTVTKMAAMAAELDSSRA